MNCRKKEMACRSGTHGYLSCLLISYLAKHDNVGILPKNSSQSRGEGHPRGLSYLSLMESCEIRLDWILKGNDVHTLSTKILYMEKAAEHRCALTASRRSGQDYHSLIATEKGLVNLKHVIRHADVLKGEDIRGACGESDSHPLTMICGEKGDPSSIGSILESEMAVLRDVMLEGRQVRQHFDPPYDMRIEDKIQFNEFIEHSVNPQGNCN